ncbi:hypothetical protein HPS54_02340 [Prevotella sp. PCHR]|uniref:DUF5703 domain-containing protein n=1 Tax=Xylanibacter caecicola TaxID=2736294 RepID=A0ABX2AYR0_9BACT|nr:DUF5703 domain-containing protein [Xylanibacter caecicola]NPE24369.1 hypothetical protein [Xylanibacter caecicola]
MKNRILLILLCISAYSFAGNYITEDYIWTSPSKNSSESMPCGGNSIGMNVWVENGDVMFYTSRSGMFDENNTLLKAGRFRLHLSTNPFADGRKDFRQILKLDDGAVYIKSSDTEIRLWADVFSPVIFMEINSSQKTDATLSYESWRYKDRPVTKAECQQCSYKWVLPKDCKTYKDTIEPQKNMLTFFHKNKEETVFDFTVSRERLDSIKDRLYNPIGGLKFGGIMYAPGFQYTDTSDGIYASTDYRAWNYRATGIKKSTVTIDLDIDRKDKIPTAKESRRRSGKWWHEYWQRSYIKAEGEAKNIVRNYELFRYMLGCNAYGEWPSKFNGGLFTFDPVYVDSKCPFTPDYRKWGGGTMTAQNQRLVYWPMLKSGDTDMMKAQFDTYLRLLPTAVERTKYYWGHDGASFCEQLENFGLPNPAEYGKHKDGDDYGMERNAWLEYQWDTALEFCSMILQAHSYTGMDICRYEPLIEQCLKFFDEHYRYLAKKRGVKEVDGDGKLILFPSSGCETYKQAYNPSSVIAALQTVNRQAGEYFSKKYATVSPTDSSSVSAPNTSSTTPNPSSANHNSSFFILHSSLKTSLPDIPLRTIGNDTCIAPAVVWARIQNVESPQLYPVFPWRIYGMGRPGLETARNTYLKDPHVIKMRSATGWKQDNIWAACLGLTDEAKHLIEEKLADGPYRFPAFWDPGYDWAPDCNKGGASMIGLQEMLLQETEDGNIMLFPAWPKEWNASFRLHATGGRTVEAEIKNGKITRKQ